MLSWIFSLYAPVLDGDKLGSVPVVMAYLLAMDGISGMWKYIALHIGFCVSIGFSFSLFLSVVKLYRNRIHVK